MKIALDYDDTYTRDPLFWNWVVDMAQCRGHTVYCVTARHDRMLDDIEQTLGRVLPPGHIIACGGTGKRKFCDDLDILIDVWIDDSPEFIVNIPLLGGLSG